MTPQRFWSLETSRVPANTHQKFPQKPEVFSSDSRCRGGWEENPDVVCGFEGLGLFRIQGLQLINPEPARKQCPGPSSQRRQIDALTRGLLKLLRYASLQLGCCVGWVFFFFLREVFGNSSWGLFGRSSAKRGCGSPGRIKHR